MRSVATGCGLAIVIGLACGGSAQAQAPAGSGAAVVGPSPASGAAPTYERKGRRDPFESIEALNPEMTSPTVASAKLKGILRGATLRALVETADGLGYILKVGDALGEGRLVQIGADSVVFIVPARQGTTTSIVLRLPDE